MKLGGNVPGWRHSTCHTAAGGSDAGRHGGFNNWAIAGSNTRSGKPILANDTHLPLSMPSYWNFMQIRAPKFQAAGVTIAGVPAVVAGFNGKLGWGMTMVMGDNQDLYLEQVRREGSRLMYLADGKWLPARERHETYFVKGERPIRETIFETRNGPLLNSVLGERKHPLQPLQLGSGYGGAENHAAGSRSHAGRLLRPVRAQSVDQAFEATGRFAPPRSIWCSPTSRALAGR